MRPWQVAVLARAPVPGRAKTRLIPRLGPSVPLPCKRT